MIRITNSDLPPCPFAQAMTALQRQGLPLRPLCTLKCDDASKVPNMGTVVQRGPREQPQLPLAPIADVALPALPRLILDPEG